MVVVSNPPAIEQSVQAIEAAVGAELPEDYRRFLLRGDGGVPDRGAFSVPEGGSSVVNRFLSTRRDEDYSLWERLDYLPDFVPDGLLPIAEDPGSNLVLLGVKGAYRGRVFFFYHDRPARRPIAEAEDITPLADSFAAFADGLREEER